MPTNTYTPLATITLGSNDSEIVFTNIPATYRDLILVINGSVNFTGPDSTLMRFNGDTGSNYANVRMIGTGSGNGSSYSDTQGYAYIGVETSARIFTIITQIMDYSATNKHKTLLSRSGQDDGWTTAHAARWANNNAINQVNVLANASGVVFYAGTTFSLYGVIA
jgi:hypothetical protein